MWPSEKVVTRLDKVAADFEAKFAWQNFPCNVVSIEDLMSFY